MSRLDSFLLRIAAQRACLVWAVEAVRGLPGVVLELGLGNGRTYDHLRELLGGSRELFAFDRQVDAHPGCIPDAAHMIVGDFRDTLPQFAASGFGHVALAHADAGSGDKAASEAQARALVPLLDPLLAPGAVIASDQDMAPAAHGWLAQELPDGVTAGRYYLYRKR
jgi:SAM-dependent methyltransferase